MFEKYDNLKQIGDRWKTTEHYAKEPPPNPQTCKIELQLRFRVKKALFLDLIQEKFDAWLYVLLTKHITIGQFCRKIRIEINKFGERITEHNAKLPLLNP